MRAKTSIALFGLVACALPVTAGASDVGGEAARCVGQSPGDRASIAFVNGGARNNGNSYVNLYCSTVRLTTSSPRTVNVDYFDASPDDSISCEVNVMDWHSGTSLWSQSKSTGVSSTSHGHFAFTISSSAVGYVVITCSIPAVAAGSGNTSVIYGYNMQ
jgi:hypothetical protein